jgi:hypothetical protein
MAAMLAAAAVATPATADGQRRTWRGSDTIGSVSPNVITPWYVGYYGGHYSYYRPTPMPRSYYDYPHSYRDGCWLAIDGYTYWAC